MKKNLFFDFKIFTLVIQNMIIKIQFYTLILSKIHNKYNNCFEYIQIYQKLVLNKIIFNFKLL